MLFSAMELSFLVIMSSPPFYTLHFTLYTREASVSANGNTGNVGMTICLANDAAAKNAPTTRSSVFTAPPSRPASAINRLLSASSRSTCVSSRSVSTTTTVPVGHCLATSPLLISNSTSFLLLHAVNIQAMQRHTDPRHTALIISVRFIWLLCSRFRTAAKLVPYRLTLCVRTVFVTFNYSTMHTF